MQQYRYSDAMALPLGLGRSPGVPVGSSSSSEYVRVTVTVQVVLVIRLVGLRVGASAARDSDCPPAWPLRGTGTPLVRLLQVLSAASLDRRGLQRVVHLPYINNGRSISQVLNFKSRQNGKETGSRCYRCLRQSKAGGAAGSISCIKRNDAGIHG